jgi:hypothetical protein
MIKLMTLKVGQYRDVLAEIQLTTASGTTTEYEYITPSKMPRVVFDELIDNWIKVKRMEREDPEVLAQDLDDEAYNVMREK